MSQMIFFALGFLLACIVIGVLYVRAKRKNESVLTLIHSDLATRLQRIEAHFDGGTIPK
jgi:uncharacterized membrane protein YciS (DUF1049 family)